MTNLDLANKRTDCFVSLPDLEAPMIQSLVSCLAREHTKLDEQILQLALAATRLAADPANDHANRHAAEGWNDIRSYLWSHLQIEDELVLTWGNARHAISGILSETLRKEREELRKLLIKLGSDAEDQHLAGDRLHREAFAKSLLALSQTLAAHIERYEGEVLPTLQRASFNR